MYIALEGRGMLLGTSVHAAFQEFEMEQVSALLKSSPLFQWELHIPNRLR